MYSPFMVWPHLHSTSHKLLSVLDFPVLEFNASKLLILQGLENGSRKVISQAVLVPSDFHYCHHFNHYCHRRSISSYPS